MAKAPAVISQKDYLQKYLTGKNVDKKKKKRKISKIAKEKRSVIVDDDEIKGMRELADGELDIFSMSEDAPQIAGIIDERPEELKTIETFRSSARWKVISDEYGIEDIRVVAVPGQPKSPGDSDDDLSPDRNTRDDSDESPPRKQNKDDSEDLPSRSKDDSPWGRRENRPASPLSTQHRRDGNHSRHARQGRDSRDSKDDGRLHARIKKEPNSPDARTRNSRETFIDSDESPPRKNSRKDRDSLEEPARTNRRDRELISNESSKKYRKEDSDESPPRKSKKGNSDESPPRKNSRKDRENPEESATMNRRDRELISNKSRKKSRRDESDESPSRKSKKGNPDESSLRRNSRKDRENPEDSARMNRRDRELISNKSSTKSRKDDSYESPPRKSKKGNSDESPPRRKSRKDRESPEESASRMKQSVSRRDKELLLSKSRKEIRKDDSDESPPRKSKMGNSDESPPRKHTKKANKESVDSSRSQQHRPALGQDSNDSYPRRSRKDDSDSDNSPPRKANKTSREDDNEPSRMGPRRLRRDSSGSAEGVGGGPMRTDRGHRSKGGQTKNPGMVSEADIMPIYRDRKTGRKRDLAAEAEQRKEEEAKTDVAKAKYTRWGAGLAQVAERETRVQDALREAVKPVARFADDADLDAMLRARDREGDPMLEYMKSKSLDVSVPSKPRYVGSFPPNRYGIAPGHRWDGVDRSTGFERRWFEGTAARQAVAEDAYKWSVADM